jgi:hypothetical protein
MKIKPFHTPILFLIFNRPDTTEKVFQRIRDIQPRQLFVSADGPRQHKMGEDLLCAETRKIVEKVDWKCELQTNFSKKNLGCRIGVSSGIDWFFRHVAEGIILEDDCLPEYSFFHFCETLLEYYRNDERIMHIGGVNFQDNQQRGSGSYYFSQLTHIWGWASWRRAWRTYDVHMSTYPQFLEQNILHLLFPNSSTQRYWKNNFDAVYNKMKDTWDLQWQYAMLSHSGLVILPSTNLISNIGFDGKATHTIDVFSTLANRPTESIDQIQHPLFVVSDSDADEYTLKKYMNPPKLVKGWQLIRRSMSR